MVPIRECGETIIKENVLVGQPNYIKEIQWAFGGDKWNLQDAHARRYHQTFRYCTDKANECEREVKYLITYLSGIPGKTGTNFSGSLLKYMSLGGQCDAEQLRVRIESAVEKVMELSQYAREEF